MKGRLASDKWRRLLHVIDLAEGSPSPSAVLPLNAEKAFDRVEWDYLWAVLWRFGFGTPFIDMICTLYSTPTACVLTGSVMSAQFPLTTGTKQDCPLSPLLFVILLEPLAQVVRQSMVISPIDIQGTKHHISLYADDTLLHLADISNSLPSALQLFDFFVLFQVTRSIGLNPLCYP